MDLELMSSLCMANWVIWTKFFTDLLALVLAYAVSILTAISFTFFQGSERNTFTFLSLCICHVLMAKIFSFQLLYHTCLIKLTSLQVYHCTSLIKLMNITSLQHNYNVFQIDITPLYNSITLFSFYPFTDSFRFWTSAFAIHFCFTRSKVCCIFHLQLHMEHFEIATSFRQLIQVHSHLIKIQCFAPYAPTKLTVGFRKIWHLLAPMKTAMHDVIKPVMVYLSAKLVMRKILVALSPGNSLNMALESPKLLSHLLQFTNFQIVPLLLENLAWFAEILSALVMSILLTVSQIHLAIMFVTLQPRVAGSQTPEEPQEHTLFPPVSGTVISTFHHQQLPIHHHLITSQLTSSSHNAITEVSLESRLVSSWH